jgi:dTDP-4-dehydrorhamnose reductase
VRALVVGAGGQLGRELVARLGDEVAWAGGRAELDVTNGEAVVTVLERVRPEVVFNAAAYNKVDAAESEPARAFEVNALAARLLALAAREVGALLVHFSTDYVFDGRSKRPYLENDPANPLGVYGVSKLTGELLVAASGCEHLIVRTSGVIGRGGSRQKGGSFVERILERARAGRPLEVVTDQVFAPTFATDLARAARLLVDTGARGLVHVTGSGSCTWHELATATLAVAGIDARVAAITTEQRAAAARRPAFSVLDTSRCLSLGLPPLPPWREALEECLAPALRDV